MIVTAAAALALAMPSREALIERWLHANRVHSPARLNSGPSAGLAPNAVAPPDLRALAQRELGIAGRYRLERPSPQRAQEAPWWLGLLRWFYDRWQQFWHTVFARVHVSKEQAASIGDVLLAILGLAFVFVLVTLLRKLQLARSAARQKSEPLEEPPAPSALYNDACEVANGGDYGTAALLLFAAAVALLVRRGAVAGATSATVGDLLRQLRARNAPLIGPFDAVAGPFVQKAYAERAVDESQWHRAHSAFLALAQEGAHS